MATRVRSSLILLLVCHALVFIHAGPGAGGSQHTVLLEPDGTVWSWGANGYGQLGDGTTVTRPTATQANVPAAVIGVAAGAFHSLALASDGTVYAWGANSEGQLGDGTTTGRPSPVALTSLTSVVAIAAGSYHSLALRSDGSVWAWGRNSNGQLGDGTTTQRSLPTLVSGLTAQAIGAAATHSLAVSADGSPCAWGANGSGQLGDGTTTQRTSPVAMAGGIANAVAVAGGNAFSVIRRSDGSLAATGANWNGQLGDGTTTQRLAPVNVAGLGNVSAVAAGTSHVIALRHDGSVWTWGLNTNGQLGDGTTTQRTVPTQVSALSAIVGIGAGPSHGVAASSEGIVWTWGANGSGQLGDGTTQQRNAPAAISDTNYVWKVATPVFTPAGGTYAANTTVTVTNATVGAVVRYTTNGQDPTESDAPIASGGTLAITESTALKARAWKSGLPPSNVAAAVYTLAVSTPAFNPAPGVYTSPRTVSLSVSTPGATIRYSVDGTDPHSGSFLYTEPLIVSTTTTIKAAAFKPGWQTSGTATGTYTMNFGTLAAPAMSPSGATFTTAVTVTLTSMMGATVRYTLDGTTPTTASPLYTGALTLSASATLRAKAWHPDYTASPVSAETYTIVVAAPSFTPTAGTYAAGETITIATDTPDATIRYTLNGGDPTTNDPTIPSGGALLVGDYVVRARAWKAGATTSPTSTATYAVSGGAVPRRIAAGTSHTMALRHDGMLWGWGGNGSRQLADGTTTTRLRPVVVGGLTGVTTMASGQDHGVAVRSDGSVLTWGANGYGQLGDGTTTVRSLPVVVSGITAVGVAAGSGHTLAIATDGTLRAWGRNGEGAVGDGTTTNRLTPVLVAGGLSDVTAVAAGWYHSVALRVDGSVWTWGQNTYGQLGDGTTTTRLVPTQVPGLANVIAIAAGGYHSVALKSDGTVLAWGSGASGQLGNGSGANRTSPTPAIALPEIGAIGAGGSHTLAIDSSGGVWAWGSNTQGQIGDGTTIGRPTPVSVTGLANAVQVVGGSAHSVALTADGVVYTWGLNGSGQLGDGTTTSRLTPVAISGPDLSWIAPTPTIGTTPGTYFSALSVTIACADPEATIRYTLNGDDPTENDPALPAGGGPVAITQSGVLKARAWKAGMPPSHVAAATYVLAVTVPSVTPPPGSYTTPQTVTLSVSTPEASIRYTTDGTAPTVESPLYAGPLVVATTTTVRAAGFRTGWQSSSVASGTYTMSFGTLTAPEMAPAGGTFTTSAAVTLASIPGAVIRYTTDGSTPTLASAVYAAPIDVTSSVTVKAVAWHPDYQTSAVSSGSFTILVAAPTLTPAAGTYPAGQRITLATATPDATIRYTLTGADPTEADPIIASGGSLPVGTYVLKARAWKAGATPSAVTSAVYMMTGGTTERRVAAGTSHALGLRGDGIPWAWGANSARQLGDGTTTPRHRPVIVGGLTGVTTLASGQDHGVAVLADGSVVSWGANSSGQLGDGTTTARSLPVPVGGVNAVAVAAGAGHTLAITPEGTLRGWGRNGEGAVGDGSTTNRLTPVAVAGGLTGVTAVAAGWYHSLALAADGSVWAWGQNTYGQLGDGTSMTRLTPTQVPGLSDVIAIAAGVYHSVALRSDGTVLAWGSGISGQLGNGSALDRPSPTPIVGLPVIMTIAAGGHHVLAADEAGGVWAWGWNGQGQLGDGTMTNRLLPIPVSGPTDIVQVAVGQAHSLALAADGVVYSWGANASGQLGDGTTTARLTPMAISGPDMAWHVPMATLSLPSGTYHQPLTVTVSSIDPEATLRYTLNGADPTPADPIVANGGGIDIVESVTLKVAAWATDGSPSQVTVASYVLQPVAPVITPAGGSYGEATTVSLSTVTPQTVIRYTTDGSEPTLGSDVYTEPFLLAQSATIRATAWRQGWAASETAVATYTIGSAVVATPTISPNGGTFDDVVVVALASATPGASIRYTVDGTVPTGSSALYTEPLPLASTTTLQARAYREGWTPSAVASATFAFDYGILSPPMASPTGGSYTQMLAVTLTSPEGAAIRYAVNGTDPTEASALYQSPIPVGAGTTTLKARAFLPDWTPSGVREETYTVVLAGPTITARVWPQATAAGWHSTDVTVTFTCTASTDVSTCAAPVTLTQEGAGQLVTGTVVDSRGQEASVSVTVNLDRSAPTAVLDAPADGTTTNAMSIAVTGTVGDALSGIVAATCNGEVATVSAGQVSCTVALQPGVNSVVLVARDGAGNSASAGARVRRTGPFSAVRLDPAMRTLLVNQAQSFTLLDEYGQVVPDAAWTSSDETVATVDADGIVTPVSAGEATITASVQGLVAEATITVVAGSVLPDGTVRWAVPVDPAPGKRPMIYPHRADPSVPHLFAVEGASADAPAVRALTLDGETLWIEAAPGSPIYGDSFGGIVAETETGLARFAGPDTARPWRYDSAGRVTAGAQAPDGTIYTIERLRGTSADGRTIWDPFILVIDGTTGGIRARVPLPRDEFIGETTSTYPNCPTRRTIQQDAPAVTSPVVGANGHGYLQVRSARQVSHGSCFGDAPQYWQYYSKDVQRTLALLRVTPAGNVSFEILDEVAFSGGYTAPVWRPDPRTTMPDGLGGMLATWDRCRDSLCGEFVRTATRFDADGNRADHVLATTFVGAPDLVMTSGHGTAWLSSSPTGYGYGTAVDVRTWATQWTSSVYAMPVAPLDDGGVALQGMDGTLYTEGADGMASPMIVLPVGSIFTVVSQLAFGEWVGHAWPGQLSPEKRMLFVTTGTGGIAEDAEAYSELQGGNLQGQRAQRKWFTRLEDAALAALDYLYQFTVKVNAEYGGYVCKAPGVRTDPYRWSNLVAGNRNGVPDSGAVAVDIWASCPIGFSKVGRFHTHTPLGEPYPSGMLGTGGDISVANINPELTFYIKAPRENSLPARLMHFVRYQQPVEYPYDAKCNVWIRTSRVWEHYRPAGLAQYCSF